MSTYQRGVGANKRGTVFKLTAAGKLTTLYSFCSKADCIDGAYPLAGVIQGRDGKLLVARLRAAAQSNIVKDVVPRTVFNDRTAGRSDQPCCSPAALDGASSGTGLIQGSDQATSTAPPTATEIAVLDLFKYYGGLPAS